MPEDASRTNRSRAAKPAGAALRRMASKLGTDFGESLVPRFALACLSSRETMAEKIRAALARLDPAIRDFHDLDHAIRSRELDLNEGRLLTLVMQKLAVRGTGRVDVSRARLEKLREQITTDLRPVLRPAELDECDLDRAFAAATRVAWAVEARRA